MTSTPRSEVEDSLNESWVELNLSSQGGSGVVTPNSVNNAGGKPLPIHCTTDMEKLLKEAQRDQSRSTSRGTSRGSSRGGSSPKSPHSPVLSSDVPGSTQSSNSDTMPGVRNTEWIWDWSSRPEHAPPKEFRFKHPENVRLSLRKSKALKSNLFSTDVLRMVVPSLIVTNLITLGLGIIIGLRVASPKASM